MIPSLKMDHVIPKKITYTIEITPYYDSKSKKGAQFRKRYNQVPHQTQDTTWESNKNTINITNKSQEVSPFSAGDHKAAMNRRKSMRIKTHKKHK